MSFFLFKRWQIGTEKMRFGGGKGRLWGRVFVHANERQVRHGVRDGHSLPLPRPFWEPSSPDPLYAYESQYVRVSSCYALELTLDAL